MLIDFRTLFPKYNIKPKGVIQIGSHWCEEHDIYLQMGISNFVYVEPCKDAFDVMLSKFGISGGSTDNTLSVTINGNMKLFKCACGDIESEMLMNVSHNNQGQSNSLLNPKLHLDQHPSVVFTDNEMVKVIPLDNIEFNRNDYNVLVMDTQGYEGQVLKGAKETLKHIDCIYTECNRGQTYAGNMEIEEMDLFLKEAGFERVETYWPSPNWTWGDCFFIRSELLSKLK